MMESQLAMLYALRAQIEALILTAEEPAPAKPAACAHPSDERVDRSTFGQPAFLCRACGQVVEGEAA